MLALALDQSEKPAGLPLELARHVLTKLPHR